jgi:hypothetical protein
MILHLAFFTWAPGVTDEQIAGLTTALTEMAAQIPTIRRYDCGPNLRVRPSDVDYAVAAVVDDADGLAAYLDHPAHVAVQRGWLDDLVATRRAAQLSTLQEEPC